MEAYVPEGALSHISGWLKSDPVSLKITRERASKLGDFRPSQNGKPAAVSVNRNLNPVEFLITLAHEFAHAENYRINGRRTKPHGKEWKHYFRAKLSELIRDGIFDEKYRDAIIRCYFMRERIATSSCPDLKRLLDEERGIVKPTRLEDIPVGSTFRMKGGKVLIKGEKIRTRYRCKESRGFRKYTVHPMAEILEFWPPR